MVSRFIQNGTRRKESLQTVANIPENLIGTEASTGAFYWQRESEPGHNVKNYLQNLLFESKNDGYYNHMILVST